MLLGSRDLARQVLLRQHLSIGALIQCHLEQVVKFAMGLVSWDIYSVVSCRFGMALLPEYTCFLTG